MKWGSSSPEFLIASSRRICDHAGQLLEHLGPTVLGAVERLLAKRLRNVEAGVLEEETRAFAVRLKSETHPRIDDGSAGRPREDKPSVRVLSGRFALQHFAVNGEPVETYFGVRRYLKRERMPDAGLEIVRVHPFCQRGAG